MKRPNTNNAALWLLVAFNVVMWCGVIPAMVAGVL